MPPPPEGPASKTSADPETVPPGMDRMAVKRLLSANPDYPTYECRADEVHVVGKVVWKFLKA